jgi:hypothetical protein
MNRGWIASAEALPDTDVARLPFPLSFAAGIEPVSPYPSSRHDGRIASNSPTHESSSESGPCRPQFVRCARVQRSSVEAQSRATEANLRQAEPSVRPASLKSPRGISESDASASCPAWRDYSQAKTGVGVENHGRFELVGAARLGKGLQNRRNCQNPRN